MDLKVNNNLQILNSHRVDSSEKKQVELFHLMNFRFDEDTSISTKEMRILPPSYKNELRDVFLRVTNQSQVQEEIRNSHSSSISLKVIDNKLMYRLDGSITYKTVQDEKIQKAFQKAAKHIKTYLQNTGSLKEKEISVSKEDQKIIQTAPSDVEKVSKEMFKKMKKSDTEWSLWAIWVCEIRGAAKKISKRLGLVVDWQSVPKGIDDMLGYVFGAFGIFNGIEMERDSAKIKDREGKYDGRHKINRNVLAMIGGAVDFASKTIAVAGKTLIKAILGIIASVIFIFVTIYATLRYVYFGLKAFGFKKKLNRYTDNERLSQSQKMISTLKFLKSKVTISKNEAAKIIAKIREKNPTLSDYKIQKLAHERIAKALLTKVKRFERRVGGGVVAMIQKNVDEILKDPTNPKNIEKANKIIKKATEKNRLTIQENKWYAIATALQGLEILLMVALGASLCATIAGALSSAIVVIMLATYFHRKHIKKIDDNEDKSMLDENLDLIMDPAI